MDKAFSLSYRASLASTAFSKPEGQGLVWLSRQGLCLGKGGNGESGHCGRRDDNDDRLVGSREIIVTCNARGGNKGGFGVRQGLRKTAWMVCVLLMIVSTAFGKQLIVDQSGSESDYTTVEAALQAAEAGDHILIRAGRYPEHNLKVTKTLTIEGEPGAIIDGEQKGFVMIVQADSVMIRGIEIHNSKVSYVEDYAGLLFDQVRGGGVEQSIFRGNFFGIYLAKSEGVTIRNNDLASSFQRESGAGNGIHLWYCKNIVVRDNRINGHRDGIYFEFVETSTITGNYSRRNMRYGLHFMFSDSCVYRRNTFRDNGAGVAVMYTQHVVMEENVFIHNWGTAAYGLLLKEIKYSKVRNNRFERNTIGLYTEASTDVAITGNEFLRNGWAAKVQANSVDNRFAENNFIANTFDVATNSRQNYNQFSGNYWSQYEGYDLDRDGVGDVPYRPVSLFSYLVQRHSTAMILLRSMLVDILNAAERVMPVLTPESLVDEQPQMRPL